jgi:hypothetical protein
MTDYTHTTFAELKTALALKLGDTGKVFTLDGEMGNAIVEARRMWNAITGYDRARGLIPTANGVAFYELSTTLKDSGATLIRPRTVTDRAVISEMEYALMEATGTIGTLRTDQYTSAEMVSALQRRRNQFLADTACVVTEYSTFVTGGADGRVDLPDNVVGIRRAVFRAVGGRCYPLRVATERTAAVTRQQWQTHGVPTMYTVAATPQLTVQLSPPPSESGTLELLVVNAGANLDITGSGTVLGVQNDLVWGVKYGALADLLQDRGAVGERCEQYYQLAVQLALTMPVVLYGELDGLVAYPAALSQTDMAWGGWQSKNPGTSTTLSIAGPDLIALTPVPNANSHSVSLEVVRNAIVPSADDDTIQMGREQLEALLGMAQHLAMVKVGGGEYAETVPLAEQFFAQAEKYAMRRSAASTALETMKRSTARELVNNPWEQAPRVIENEEDVTRLERNARRRSSFRKR